MKKINLFAAALLMMAGMLTSCGAKKQVAGNGYYQSQNQNQLQTRPTATKVDVDECVLLQDEDPTKMRAVGIAQSFVEREALNLARRDARNELARMLQTAVEEAAKGSSKSGQIDQRVTSELLDQSQYKQFIAEEIKNSKSIKTSKYILSDGSIQIYVCLEMLPSVQEFTKKMAQELSQDEMLRMKFDQLEFEKEMKNELEEYKANRRKQN
jgi:acylphosphatase